MFQSPVLHLAGTHTVLVAANLCLTNTVSGQVSPRAVQSFLLPHSSWKCWAEELGGLRCWLNEPGRNGRHRYAAGWFINTSRFFFHAVGDWKPFLLQKRMSSRKGTTGRGQSCARSVDRPAQRCSGVFMDVATMCKVEGAACDGTWTLQKRAMSVRDG